MVELSVVPIGEGTSLSRFVACAIKELERRGLRLQVNPMATVFEAKTPREALEAAEAAHEALFKAGVKRVLTTIKLDDRRDVQRRMEDKVESVKRALRLQGL